MRSTLARLAWSALAAGCAIASAPTAAQDAANGAMLYMRLASDARACVSCHGPDPGLSHNNILRAADNPAALTQVLNTVSVMGFLRPLLSDTDRADVAAFLGTVSRLNASERALRLWPVTLEFGTAPVNGLSAPQSVRVTNASATQPLALTAITASHPEFMLSHDCPAALAPGAACDAHLRLRPGVTGLVRGALQVQSAGAPYYAGLSGYGAAGPLSQLDWRIGGAPASAVVRFAAPGAQGVQRQTLALVNPGPMPALLGLTSITGPRATQYQVERGCASGTVLLAGTQCELVLAYTPGALAEAQAVLQLRSDQGNPMSLRLEGAGLAQEPKSEDPPAPALAESGGGCSVGPPNLRRTDPLLLLAAFLAALAAWKRQRVRRPKP
jgi:cytochrome c553